MCDCGNSSTGKYFSKVGGQLGDRLNNYGVAAVANVQKRFKDWSGLGDYKVNMNSLIQGGAGSTDHALNIRQDGRGTIIRYREYVGDVVTSSVNVGALNIVAYRVQPGDVTTFPWLGTIATQYDQYIPMGIIWEYRSTTSDTSTTSALGSVIFSTNYDVTDPAPVTKQELLNNAYSNETKMSNDLLHGLECDPSEMPQTIYYTRSVGLDVTNVQEYDMCTTYVTTQGGSVPVNTIVGSLYVHYEFLFLKEKLYAGIAMKNSLYAVYDSLHTVAGTAVNWELVLKSRTGGIDFGITGNGGTLNIPRKWAGANFEMQLFWFPNNLEVNTFTTVIAPTVTYAQCNQTPSGSIGFGPVSTSAFTSQPRGVVPISATCSITNYFQISPTANRDASIAQTNFQTLPTVVPAVTAGFGGGWGTILILRVVPRNFASELAPA